MDLQSLQGSQKVIYYQLINEFMVRPPWSGPGPGPFRRNRAPENILSPFNWEGRGEFINHLARIQPWPGHGKAKRNPRDPKAAPLASRPSPLGNGLAKSWPSQTKQDRSGGHDN